jgi:hypothetical protein
LRPSLLRPGEVEAEGFQFSLAGLPTAVTGHFWFDFELPARPVVPNQAQDEPVNGPITKM